MADLEQKYSTDQIDVASLSGGENADLEDAAYEKRVVRRIDMHLIPWLALLYLLSFLDRTNIGNANIFGLSKNLHLKPREYSNCLAIFFVFYVIFETPSNMVMKAWRPSRWLPLIMLGWGIVITLTGIVHNFPGLFTARVFLGITESGLFPGVTFFLSQWYLRHEVALRISIFFSAATIAGAFGGLLARLINLMHGVGGLEGWRWIFILEGIATVIVAVASFWMLHDYPATAKFLDERERRFVVARLARDDSGLATRYDTKFISQAFLDWKVWAFSIMYIGTLMPLYSFSLFSPTIVRDLGYTAATAQLLSVPPYIIAAFATIGAGYMSDRFQKRGIFVIAFSSIGILGFVLNIVTRNPHIRYAGVFLGAIGICAFNFFCLPRRRLPSHTQTDPNVPLVVSWSANSFGGSTKKAIGMAMVVSVGNCGGIFSSYVYRVVDSPKYYLGHGSVMGCIFLQLAIATLLITVLNKENNAKQRIVDARGGAPWTAEEKKRHEDDGDKAPFFFYTL
ncbi:MFS transporter, ACS family, pantothenate transporter, partial [Phenoliferia sp. Uapishka_3]